MKAFFKKIGTTLRLLEQNTQWENFVELYVGLMKEAFQKDIKVSGLTLVLWNYTEDQRAAILFLKARDIFQLQGSNPYTSTFGKEVDISNLCQFAWYEWVYFMMIIREVTSPFRRICLDGVWAQLIVKEMIQHSGFSRKMGSFLLVQAAKDNCGATGTLK